MHFSAFVKPLEQSRVSFWALSAVLALTEGSALAQQSLPTIDIGGARRATTRTSAPRPVRAPPIVADRAPAAGTPTPAPFLPQGQQVWRGPTDVVGYFAGGTSTATKTNTPIQDIPQSVTILTKQQLEDRNSLTLNQALAYVPGVTVAQGEGQRDQITIRGQPTTADFYTDGVRDDAEYYRDLYNIEAVEVLKGPSALIFGRGGGGGVVNRVTKKANGETLRSMQVSTGSFGRKRVSVDIGQALTDALAFRVNGLYEQSYGYRNFFNLERYGINPPSPGSRSRRPLSRSVTSITTIAASLTAAFHRRVSTSRRLPSRRGGSASASSSRAIRRRSTTGHSSAIRTTTIPRSTSTAPCWP